MTRPFSFQRPPKCGAGHTFPKTVLIPDDSHGAVRCAECGKWTYLIPLRGGGAFCVPVTLTELTELEKIATPADAITYLKIFTS